MIDYSKYYDGHNGFLWDVTCLASYKKEKSPIVKKELFKMAARWLFWFGAFAQIGNPYTHWFFDEQEFGYNGTVAVIA